MCLGSWSRHDLVSTKDILGVIKSDTGKKREIAEVKKTE
jgi:hypothetical protein